jgi:hypothetical protein
MMPDQMLVNLVWKIEAPLLIELTLPSFLLLCSAVTMVNIYTLIFVIESPKSGSL